MAWGEALSAIIHLPAVHLCLSVPGPTPQAGLTNALQLVRDGLHEFPAAPAPEALAAALCGLAWRRHPHVLRILPSPTPQERTTHLIVVGLTGTPYLSISTIVHDEEDDTRGQIHEGHFIAADILRDIERIVRALT